MAKSPAPRFSYNHLMVGMLSPQERMQARYKTIRDVQPMPPKNPKMGTKPGTFSKEAMRKRGF